MPEGPKGQKRQADVTKNAVLVMRIATGEVEEVDTRNRAALGLIGMAGDCFDCAGGGIGPERMRGAFTFQAAAVAA